MPRTAYSYIRMSTPSQIKGDSLRRQADSSLRYALEHNLDIDETLELKDLGVSAYKGDNATTGALSRFLQAVDTGRVSPGSVLLVESLDRLSRQRVGAAMSLFLNIVERGITIVTLSDGQIYAPGISDPIPLLQSLLIMSRAHEESQLKGQRVAAAWQRKRDTIDLEKLSKQCPLWLRLADDRKQFFVQADRAEIVRTIFEWSLEGLGRYSIAKRLNGDSVPPFGRAAKWQESYVEKILSNRAVIGEFQPHRKIDGRRIPHGAAIADYFPAVVERDLFYAVQGVRFERRSGAGGRRGVDHANLFTHVARCGECGDPMRMVNKGKKPKGGRYLRCASSLLGSGCTAKAWPYEAFERAFLSFCGEIDIASAEDAADHQAANTARLQSIAASEERLRLARIRRDNAFTLLDGTADVAYIQIKIEQCNEEVRLLTGELEAARTLKVFIPTREETVSLVERVKGVRHGGTEFRLRVATRLKQIVRSLRLYPTGIDAGRMLKPFSNADWLNDPVSRTQDFGIPAFAVEFSSGLRRHVVAGIDAVSPYAIITEAPGVGDPQLLRLKRKELALMGLVAA
ncbi:recombinase family protein [Devosia rhizoryzae]|uniref:Recombinase family protein n=1 Tax=Devosia rhizoryzae TaxID=2774137 RepID=A0ABX7C476_9HYPH|nr:recombinase family protein [Devosia rhizoryzae]QQR39030.1 recombinase family protein [Devosia rhizoryzae]